MAPRWTLTELADFEALLTKAEVEETDHTLVAEALEKMGKGAEESKQRSTGLRAWFERSLSDNPSIEAGDRLRLTMGLVQFIIVVLSLVAGIALMAGLVERVGVTEGKAYNVWKLIAIPLGAQWVFLILALLSWIVLRKNDRKMTLSEEIGAQVIKLFAGRKGAQGWNQLHRAGAAYREILGWRVASLAQWGAVAFNIGIIGGFLAILSFLEVNFFWATTLDDFGLPQLQRVTQFLGAPWGWFEPEMIPNREQMLLTQLQIGELNANGEAKWWYEFLLACFVVWGLLPRVLTAIWCHSMERQGLGKLTFMEKRHRDLWRKLTPRVNTKSAYTVAQDGVVLIDVGGTDATTDELRPFLLQQLRVNPTERFTAGVLNDNQKDDALASLAKAKCGVVLLVESWNLSPKQLQVFHKTLREVISDRTILYLVLGLPKAGVTQAPDATEFAEWEHFVTDLNDPETEIIAYSTSTI